MEAAAGTLVQKDTVAQDQIDHTLRQNPEIPTQRNVPAKPATLSRAAPVAPPPPTNSAPAPAQKKDTPAPRPASDAPDHAAWDALLQDFVSSSGNVNYADLKKNESKLEPYLSTLARKTPGDGWSRDESLAYWINTYNAYTVKLILDNYPIKSIQEIEKPWDKKWIKLGGKTYSLNNIEHDIVRPTFKEARIHFALVCAAKSCPPLPNRAFTAQNLDEMLGRRARAFINDEKLNVTQEEVVRVSPIFDWYAEDFGGVRQFLNRYLEVDIPPAKDINFLDYDWALNGR